MERPSVLRINREDLGFLLGGLNPSGAAHGLADESELMSNLARPMFIAYPQRRQNTSRVG
jgi:hypothetical protein